MIDPLLSLAVSIQSNPGVYALLLGSGISRSSGVPTGWEIVEELVRKLAKLKGEQCDDDPHGWYRSSFGQDPDYSEILNEIAKTSAERMQLLRGYFEPTDEERQEGRKLPTPAHRAIAELAAKGYVRILITTNFDRLLESALADVGIQPVVIGSADAAKGALPLAHSRCTVLKLNGDYLDSRLKNTNDELANYEDSIERLLDQVFDPYGLVVCGWSGEWDTALRGALERCSTRRFTMYWAKRGELSQKARDLVTLRQATLIPITGADEFCGDLCSKITALEDMATTDVISAKVAVARMKRYLADPVHRINLHDLLISETEKAYAQLIGPRYSVSPKSLSYADITPRMSAYEGAIEAVLRLMICGAHWGEPQHDAVLLRCYKRVADQRPFQASFMVLNKLALYPALLLLYGAGISAIAHNNYRFLRNLLGLKVKYNAYKPEKSVAVTIQDQAVLARNEQKQAIGSFHTPLSDHMFELLRDPLREYLPSESEYDQAFDWFEYLLCLSHCDAAFSGSDLKSKIVEKPDFTLAASVGRFGWKSQDGERNIQEETEMVDNEPCPEKVAAVLTAGFFESDGRRTDKYRDVKAAFDRFVDKVRVEWMISF